ncbi:hypothetical protein [Vibrio campbellii]|uniref:hypothetical protein n=1 Tax=Vibrio campbellii TaxID=680 RepID=UPI00210C4FE1|nr:hypothetical protein [Vibrio campbellii]UTZ44687.1 hypothetical protein HB764_25850 [Vibrio campbellii]
MTAYKKVRKNAKKQITKILSDSVGIIARSSSMQIDDSYDNKYRLVSAEQVLSWLSDDENYSDANCYFLDGEFHVGGPYSFCDKFTAYFEPEKFESDTLRFDLIKTELVDTPKSAEVIRVDFARRVRLSA